MATRHPALRDGHVKLVVLPSFPYLIEALDIFAETPVYIGGQDLYSSDEGAFTGEVSGAQLAELGCRYVEVGTLSDDASSARTTRSSPPRPPPPTAIT